MNFLEKIQNLPAGKRKFILWFLLVIIALLMFYFYGKDVSARLKNLTGENFKKGLNLDKLKEGFDQMPKLQMPKIEIPAQGTEATGTENTATSTQEISSSTEENFLN
jgi:hypothetical protein